MIKKSNRSRGSCRFKTYYTMQRYDDALGVWRPMPGRFETKSAAQASLKLKVYGYRIREVSMQGNRIIS